MNLIEVFNKYPTQKDCIEYLEKIKWQEKPICPYCKSNKSHRMPAENRHYCHNCLTSYRVTVGTIFHDTRLPLQKWFLAISLIMNAKKGIASRQLAKDIQVTKDTAWSIQMRIRKAMIETPSLLTGIVEMDETYIGGKPRKSNNPNNNTPLKRGRGNKKTAVVGVVERKGKVFDRKMQKLSFKDLKRTAKQVIDFDNAVLMTDDYRGYIPFKNLIEHQVVNHSNKQYVSGIKHTNTIEVFWALLKRGIAGQYHHLSDRYLNKYIIEFCFRYNNRDNKNLFKDTITSALNF